MKRAVVLALSLFAALLLSVPALAEQIITDTDTLSVPEGGSATFDVKLDTAPAGSITVNVDCVRSTGDFQVTGGSTLTFTPDDWDEYQTVTVSAATDADSVVENAVVRASADGWISADVTIWEFEAQATLTVQSTPVTGVEIAGTPSGTTGYSQLMSVDDEVTITAPPWAGDHYFVQWLDDNGDPITSDSTLNFPLLDDTTVSAQYSDSGHSADYYVNDDTPETDFAAGDDGNSGLTADEPMRHIQALLDRYPYIGTGCTLHISVGAYDELVALSAAHSGLTMEGAGAGNSIITAALSGRPLTCEGFTGTVTGFTFSDGSTDVGGGVFCGSSSALTMESCAVTGCHADTAGGGIACWSSQLALNGCVVAGNTTDGLSGGIDIFLGESNLRNDVITGNVAALDGGGIGASEANVAVDLSVLADNSSSTTGGGVCASTDSEVTLTNSILWHNTADLAGPQIALTATAGASVAYCDVEGGELEVYAPDGSTLDWQAGNIDADPLFVAAGYWDAGDWVGGDYHLQSTGGHWFSGGWVADLFTSPCIDAGDPAAAFANEPAPNGGRVNIDAYGNTDQASKPLFYLVTVQSTLISSVLISGTPSGHTSYSSWRSPGSAVTLTAPATRTVSGRTYYFVRWTRNGVNQSAGRATLAFSATQNTTAVAVYKRVKSLAISGPLTVNESTTAKYALRAYYTDGSAATVTTRARWADNSTYARFISAGALKLSAVRATLRCRITASYGGVSKYVNITIKNVR